MANWWEKYQTEPSGGWWSKYDVSPDQVDDGGYARAKALQAQQNVTTGDGAPDFGPPTTPEQMQAAFAGAGQGVRKTADALGRELPRAGASGLGGLMQFGVDMARMANTANPFGHLPYLSDFNEAAVEPIERSAQGVRREVAQERQADKEAGLSTPLSRIAGGVEEGLFQLPEYLVPEGKLGRYAGAAVKALPAATEAAKERYRTLIEQGVDPEHAVASAAVTGITAEAGGILPMGLPGTLATRAATAIPVGVAQTNVSRVADNLTRDPGAILHGVAQALREKGFSDASKWVDDKAEQQKVYRPDLQAPYSHEESIVAGLSSAGLAATLGGGHPAVNEGIRLADEIIKSAGVNETPTAGPVQTSAEPLATPQETPTPKTQDDLVSRIRDLKDRAAKVTEDASRGFPQEDPAQTRIRDIEVQQRQTLKDQSEQEILKQTVQSAPNFFSGDVEQMRASLKEAGLPQGSVVMKDGSPVGLRFGKAVAEKVRPVLENKTVPEQTGVPVEEMPNVPDIPTRVRSEPIPELVPGKSTESASVPEASNGARSDGRDAESNAVPDYTQRFNDLRSRRASLTDQEKAELLDLHETDRTTAKMAGKPILGVKNRTAYEEALAEGTLKPAQVFTDADNFKAVNDKLGHGVGDKVLRDLGDAYKEAFGEGNVFHFGGDEFVPQADTPEQAHAAMEQVRAKMAAKTYVAEDKAGNIIGQRDGIGVSYGVGKDKAEAELEQYADKKRRAEAGLRTERATDAGRVAEGTDGQPEAGPADRTDQGVGQAQKLSRGAQSGGTVEGARKAAEKAWGRDAIHRLTTRGGLEFTTVADAVARKLGGHESPEALADVKGFYDPKTGKAHVLADNLSPDEVAGVVSHEVFHANAEKFLGDARFKALKSAFGRLKDPSVKDAYAKVPKDTPEAHRDEEAMAYLIEDAPNHPASKRIVDQAKLFLNRMGVPLNWLNAHDAAVREIARLNLKDASERGPSVGRMDDGTKYQRVYHGTPHKGIEKEGFNLDKIGTGEGAQAYGHGIYFAGNKDVAEGYRERLSDPRVAQETRRLREYFQPGKIVKGYAGTRDMVKEFVPGNGPYNWHVKVQEVNSEGKPVGEIRQHSTRPSERQFKDAGVSPEHPGLSINGIDISDADSLMTAMSMRLRDDPEDSEALAMLSLVRNDGDKARAKKMIARDGFAYLPRSAETNAKAIEYIDKADVPENGQLYHAEIPDDPEFLDWDKPLSEQTGAVSSKLRTMRQDMTGGEFYKGLAKHLGGQKEASDALRKIGIPGLRYLDGNSRRAGEGTHNYVIWDQLHLNKDVTPYYSKRAYMAKDQTETPEFRRWFGDSKVVDEDGKPQVVYHGTDSRFNSFSEEKIGTGADSSPFVGGTGFGGKGFYFSPDRDTAEGYGRHVVPVYLSIKNPFIVPKYTSAASYASKILGKEVTLKTLRDELLIHGNDGIIKEDPYKKEYIAFHPEQIKSATKNKGAFDPSNPDIRYSKHTPEQKEALAKAGMPTEPTGGHLESLKEELGKLKAIAHGDGAQAVFDRFHGIKMAEDRARNEIGPIAPEQDGYLAARLSTGAGSSTEHVIRFGGLKWEDGVLAPDENVKGLLDSLEPVRGRVNDFLGWMVGNRAERLKAEGRENNLSDQDIQALKSLAGPDQAKFEQAAKDYAALNKSVLDVAEQAGTIDPVTRAVWENADYVPFFRDLGDEKSGPGTTSGLSGQRGVKQLKGGTSKLKDPLENIVQNFHSLIDSAMKNEAMRRVIENTMDLGVVQDETMDHAPATIPMSQVKKVLRDRGVTDQQLKSLPPDVFDGVQRMLSIVPPKDPDVVRVMEEGKPKYYRVLDPTLLRAVSAFATPKKGAFLKLMSFAKMMLTQGTTANPAFMVRNWLRDTAHSYVINPHQMLPGIRAVKGVLQTAMKDPTYRRLMAAGALFGHGRFDAMNREFAAKNIRIALRAKGWGSKDIGDYMHSLVDTPAKLWEAWHAVGAAAENANRIGTYESTLQNTGSRAQAAYDAKDLLDFTMRGDSQMIKFLGDVLPFYNARMQGLYKLYRAGAIPSRRMKAIVAMKALAFMAASTGYIANILADKDKKEKYDALEDWDKDNNWHFWADGKHFRVPKPFEIGLLYGTTAEHLYRTMLGQEDAGKAVERMGANLWTTLEQNPTPQLLRPALDLYANKDSFTGRPIENQSDENKLPWDRFEEGERPTSPIMKKLSEVTGKTATAAAQSTSPTASPVGLSPKQMEYLWDQYTGALGQYALGMADTLVKVGQSKEPVSAGKAASSMLGLSSPPGEPAQKDLPVLGWFVKKDDNTAYTRYQTELFDAMKYADQLQGSLKSYKESDDAEKADQFERDNQAMLGLKSPLGRLRQSLGKLRKEVKEIANSDDTPEEKRRKIDELMRERNDLTKGFYYQDFQPAVSQKKEGK